MRAVVESIAEVGYQRTTSAEIARRAGVTWGAVQHHFRDKEGILMAVLADSFDSFENALGGALEPGGAAPALEERVSLFVDRAWAHFGSPRFRSTFEILLNLPQDLDLPWQQDVLTAWYGIWSRYFPGSRPSKRQTVDLMHYTVSTLAGLAATKILEGAARDARASELGFLKDTLVRELSR
jgi:AcrR family transcriptional regulator